MRCVVVYLNMYVESKFWTCIIALNFGVWAIRFWFLCTRMSMRSVGDEDEDIVHLPFYDNGEFGNDRFPIE